MPVILVYYVAGLSLALAIGAICYFFVGHSVTPLLRDLFGCQAAPLFGRLFRISIVTAGIVGALSSKFYGCNGPTDYDAVAKNHDLLLERTTAQVSGSLDSIVQFLLFAAAALALAFAARHVGQRRAGATSDTAGGS